MKLKITEQGWEGFNGELGMVAFEDGVSIRDVTPIEANIISGAMRVVAVETGESVGALCLDADAMNRPAHTTSLKTLAEILAEREAGVKVLAQIMAPNESKTYTKEELEGVADKSGIAGLREIGDAMDVKSASISGLIDAILAKQTPTEPDAAMLAQGQPDVVTTEQAQ